MYQEILRMGKVRSGGFSVCLDIIGENDQINNYNLHFTPCAFDYLNFLSQFSVW